MTSPSVAVVNARIKDMVWLLGISVSSQSQSTLIPKPDVAFSQLAHTQCLSCLHTRGRENHQGHLYCHFREVRHPNNAPLPISIPLDKIPKNGLDCRLPDEDVISLIEAWRCDSSVLPQLIVFSTMNAWAISGLLKGFYVLSKPRKCSTVLEDGLKG